MKIQHVSITIREGHLFVRMGILEFQLNARIVYFPRYVRFPRITPYRKTANNLVHLYFISVRNSFCRFQGHFVLPIQRLAESGREFAEFHPRDRQVRRDGRSLEKRTPGTCSCLLKVRLKRDQGSISSMFFGQLLC